MDEEIINSNILYTTPFLQYVQIGRTSWQVHNLLSKRTLVVDNYSVALLMSFHQGKPVSNVLEYFVENTDGDRKAMLQLIRKLLEHRFLTHDLSEVSEILETRKRWREKGWAIAFEHHLASFNYPYLDYQDAGVSSDRGLMRAYYAQEPDLVRFKTSEGNLEIACPPIYQALENLKSPLDIEPKITFPTAQIGMVECAMIMSITFGVIEWRGKNSELTRQTARRTSPSGGARHPSEGYLLNIEIEDFETGLYHFNTLRNVLVKIANLPKEFNLERRFEAMNISGIKPQAIVLFSSCPARNMYRYREPRTLRTIFMDIGHLAATSELAAEALGFRVLGHHGFDNSYLEDLAEFDSVFQETYLYMVAIEGLRSE